MSTMSTMTQYQRMPHDPACEAAYGAMHAKIATHINLESLGRELNLLGECEAIGV